METWIYLLVCFIEVAFLIWSFLTKDFLKKKKGMVRIGLCTILGFLLITNVLQGLSRYGFILFILLIQSCLNLIMYRKDNKNNYRKIRQVGAFFGNCLLYFLALIPAFLFPQYKPLPVTGSYAVETAEYTYVDSNRIETYADTGENRAVTVKFWYPEQDGEYPLVVFSHGAFGIIDSNFSTFMELASHGYVVASIGHPYHAMFVKDVDKKMTYVSKEFLDEINTMNQNDSSEDDEVSYNNSRKWMEIRTADMNFILDTILDNAESTIESPFSMIDREKIGLFGHSMGGATSVQLGRMREDIDAVIDLEGTMLGEYTGFENGQVVFNQDPYKIPLLDVNSRLVFELAKEVSEKGYVNFYVGENALCFREVVIDGAGHLNFTDLPIVSPILARMLGVGNVDSHTCMENVNHIVLTFFNYYLKGEGELNIEKEY